MRRVGMLLPVGDRGLVAMMAVGDQERRGELELARLDRPDPRAHAALDDVCSRLARRPLEERLGVVEQEDRLELCPRRAQQAQAPFLRSGMRALVRQDDPVLVRDGRHRRREPFARACDPVRAGVVLRDPPVGLRRFDEHAARAPLGQVARGPLLRVRQRQMHDVVRAAREVLEPLRIRDHVVGRRDERAERAGDCRVVAQSAKWPDRGHSCRLDSMVRTLEEAAAFVDDAGLALLLPEG